MKAGQLGQKVETESGALDQDECFNQSQKLETEDDMELNDGPVSTESLVKEFWNKTSRKVTYAAVQTRS